MRPSIPPSLRLPSQRYYRHLAQPRIPVRSSRVPLLTSPHTQLQIRHNTKPPTTVQSTYSSYIIVFALICGSAVTYEYFARNQDLQVILPAPPPTIEKRPTVLDPRTPDYASMPSPEGTLGNLTPEQEVKLRDFWILTLKTFGVIDSDTAVRASTDSARHSQVESPEKKKKKKSSFFSRGRHDDNDSAASGAEEDDKYGQTAELQQIIKTHSPEALRTAFWESMKNENPDAMLLRFLRARKWDIDKALAMMVSTGDWRKQEMHVDEDILIKGEAGALADSQSSDSAVKKEGNDFLSQIRMGKSFLHGTDKEGRPITYVRVRLHKGGEQTEKSMERYTVYVIENARLLLKSPVETGMIVFDMTNFTLANMDYTPVKFMIKVFEANYPESLGAVLVHKAPWVFNAIWKVIKGWLDPVVASKIHFTNTVEDMEHYIPRNQIIKEIGGDEDWEYKYVEPMEGENDAMKDTVTKNKLDDERKKINSEYEQLTVKWTLAATSNSKDEAEKLHTERQSLAKRLYENYWQLDPYVRARGLYDRVGMIEKGGIVHFYPTHSLKVDNVNGSATAGDIAAKPADIHPEDDVD